MARVWLIAGPTASGKSGLAMRLAAAIGGELVNADSMQIYRDLRVLTARPTATEGALAPHHLYGVADATESWSVARWLDTARCTLGEIAARGRTAIVVGGTGLYFRALTQGLADIPPIPDAIRLAARSAFADMGEAAFRKELGASDPESAVGIAPGDRQRLVRAMEVVRATGRPIGDWRGADIPTLTPGAYTGLVLDPPRAELYARCDARLSSMIAEGAVEEVRALLGRKLDPELPAMKALGVRELARHFRAELSLAQALALAQQETRRYAKRQATWFRHQTPDWPRVISLDPTSQWRELQAVLADPP